MNWSTSFGKTLAPNWPPFLLVPLARRTQTNHTVSSESSQLKGKKKETLLLLVRLPFSQPEIKSQLEKKAVSTKKGTTNERHDARQRCFNFQCIAHRAISGGKEARAGGEMTGGSLSEVKKGLLFYTFSMSRLPALVTRKAVS